MKKKKFKFSGMRLLPFNYVMVFITVLTATLLLIFSHQTTSGHKNLQVATLNYIEMHKNADNMLSGSDYLTEQVRCYVITGDIKYLRNYFYESEVTQTRDKALEAIRTRNENTEAYASLKNAMDESLDLMNLEYYAMRLKAESIGYDVSALPQEIIDVELTDEDENLSLEEKDARAENIVFGDQYQSKKETIIRNVSLCTEQLEKILFDRQTAAEAELKDLIVRERIMIVIFIVVVIGMIVLTITQVFLPLIRAVPLIQQEKPIPVTGSHEYRFLARTYNRMYEHYQQHEAKLLNDIIHDSLTGIYNRNQFDSLMQNKKSSVCSLILIDVNDFKNINDNNGHDVGDKVLMTVAQKLDAIFFKHGYVCRIGGDEFAVVITKPNISESDLKKCIATLNNILETADDTLPRVSISAGISFNEKNKDVKTLFKEADTELYASKKERRCEVHFS